MQSPRRFRLRDRDGALVGTTMISKPAAGWAKIATMTSMGGLRHFEACSASLALDDVGGGRPD